jgi:hypothetical protein
VKSACFHWFQAQTLAVMELWWILAEASLNASNSDVDLLVFRYLACSVCRRPAYHKIFLYARQHRTDFIQIHPYLKWHPNALTRSPRPCTLLPMRSDKSKRVRQAYI